ncbi:MAG: SpoIID/LytB domain-containing protein [Lachnospiraceae bacterium]
MDFHQKKKLCLLLILILLLLALLPSLFFGKKGPQGEYITTKEVRVLTQLLGEVYQAYEDKEKEGEAQFEFSDSGFSAESWKRALDSMEEMALQWEEGNLTYGQFVDWRKASHLESAGEMDFENRYKKSHFLLKKDWYAYFDRLCEIVDARKMIQKRELLILGDSGMVKDREGNPVAVGQLFSQNGLWEDKLASGEELLQKKGEYITFNQGIWGVVSIQEEGELKNVWLVDNQEESLVYFYGNYEVTSPVAGAGEREQVADLYFSQGKLKKIVEKKNRISGEVLKLTDTQIEIKGQGTFELADNIQYYRLYDSLQTVGRNSVRIGYNFADFVLEGDKIQAGLLVKDEQMESIRVLLKNSNFDGYYHERVECSSDVDMELLYGKESLVVPAGESLYLDTGSEYFKAGRIYLRPKAHTGRTAFSSIARSNQGQGYHGSFELEKRDEGIVIINELLLEEYLYAVVPSEMPGYYPAEALKAQAICARTYAYDKMLNSSLSSWGAHLDDSSTFQVYNNIRENANTTRAVKETKGLLLYNPKGLASTYYYSTSCGFGTSDAIWNREGINQLSYLQAREMTEQEGKFTSQELMDEETFRSYIENSFSEHFEAQEPWYRWTYEHQKIQHILENLTARQEKYPNDILVSSDGGSSFVAAPIPGKLTLTDIKVRSRGAGGTVEELLFIGKEAQVLVKKELNVRAVLTDGEAQVVLQDGKTYACRNLLPSAFYYITVETQGEKVVSLKLKGGGFGHGVGMSQNGAKNLANNGRNYEEILTFYYAGCQVQQPD